MRQYYVMVALIFFSGVGHASTSTEVVSYAVRVGSDLSGAGWGLPVKFIWKKSRSQLFTLESATIIPTTSEAYKRIEKVILAEYAYKKIAEKILYLVPSSRSEESELVEFSPESELLKAVPMAIENYFKTGLFATVNPAWGRILRYVHLGRELTQTWNTGKFAEGFPLKDIELITTEEGVVLSGSDATAVLLGSDWVGKLKRSRFRCETTLF